MPDQRGALDACREATHPAKRVKLAELGLAVTGGIARHQTAKLLKEGSGFPDALSLESLRHYRRGRGRDGASRSFERDVLQHLAVERHVDRHAISTQRVIAFGLPARYRRATAVPRAPVVVQDQLLVEIGQLGHDPNTSRAVLRPVPRASISERVLYRASEARTVAVSPNRCITGWAQ